VRHNDLQQSAPHYYGSSIFWAPLDHPLYELPFPGIPGKQGVIDALADGEIGTLQSPFRALDRPACKTDKKDVGSQPQPFPAIPDQSMEP